MSRESWTWQSALRGWWLGLVVLSLSCRARQPERPDAGPIPPKVVHVLVLSSPALLVERVTATRERWTKNAGWPNALVLANGLPEVPKDEVPAVASALTSLNLAAFTLGRRDASWGRESLELIRTTTNAQWLGANVDSSWPGASTVSTFERSRLPVSVIGLSELAGVEGFTERPLEGVVASTLESVKASAAIVLLMQGCSRELATLIKTHPAWKLDLVVAERCDGEKDERIGSTIILHAGADQYVELRVELGAVRSLSARVEQLPMLDAGQR